MGRGFHAICPSRNLLAWLSRAQLAYGDVPRMSRRSPASHLGLLAVNERVAVRVGTGGATLRGRQIAVRLRELRDAAGLTGEEVARRMARAHSTLSRWETGGLIPRPPDVFFMLD